MPEPTPLILVHPDKSVLRAAAGARILTTLSEVLAGQDVAHVSLTGGTMGIAVWEEVAESPFRDVVDWSRMHFWWSDERFVASGDSDRNAQQAFDAFLGAFSVPPENIHVVGSSDEFADQDAAASAYAEELARWAPEGEDFPFFDLTLLGMGPDGHLASLFPHREEIHLPEAGAVGVEDSPKPPPLRVSLTLPLINRSVRTWFLVAGADKAEAFGRLQRLAGSQAGPDDLIDTPSAGARGTQETLYLVTEDALSR